MRGRSNDRATVAAGGNNRYDRPRKRKDVDRRCPLHPCLDTTMNITFGFAPLVSLIAGILILIVPRLLNYIVAIYLILIGLIGLFGAGTFHV
jgi:hypothetical protein